ncbi:DUF429 domain-containing protein [uncultured Pseudokineococcus sp.]|uniref:DUF429 domain-containing protein n=1 Tax=uncultured Pseudokineococcus sp. TaxID=1642928 RepID=UPI002602ECF9|nr:DUF429 domain-containing protein [uncultured Pseudokineococcus sp.]
MITTGVDLATEPVKTGMATIRWGTDGAVLTDLRLGVDDGAIVDAAATSTKLGLDCPLGWPDVFVEMLTRHHTDHLEPHALDDADWRRGLANRATDVAVTQTTGLRPLSVAADRIGLTAMRAANLLGRLAAAGSPVDRAGTGVVVEVYPAASLAVWGLGSRGYKGSSRTAALGALVDGLLEAAPWLWLGEHEDLCRRRDDAFDALVAALTARAAALGLTSAPTDTPARARARREGWIAVPTSALRDLSS